MLLTSISYEQIGLARTYLEGDYRYQATRPFPFELPTSLLVLARISTLWNLAEQSLIAITFLSALDSRLGRLRDPLLLVFCLTTYSVAPVASFGWLILAMGVAQANNSMILRYAYLATFAVLAFYDQVPRALPLVNAFELAYSIDLAEIKHG